jgi:hypothetical protein
MTYIIEVLKDTPFHSRGTKLKMTEFRDKYGSLFLKSMTDHGIVMQLVREQETKNSFNPTEKFISDWFAVSIVHLPEELPLAFIYEDKYYIKELDGMYHVFLSPTHYKWWKQGNKEAKFAIVHVSDIKIVLSNVKCEVQFIPYYTSDIEKKL